MFNQYIHEIVYLNSKTELGFIELVSNEISRIEEADIGAININGGNEVLLWKRWRRELRYSLFRAFIIIAF